jgi:DNA-binding HxlR family transcriptional regulator
VRGYGQPFCPISRASEIFATRWTPLIVRNLLLGCRTFGELQTAAPGIPRSLLTERLHQLERLEIVDRSPNPGRRGFVYELTEAGQQLAPVCHALGTWGARWLESAPTRVDAAVLLWAISKSMDADRFPDQRVVIRFDFRDQPKAKKRYWLLVQRPEPEVCRKPPGFPDDLVVTTDTEWLSKWHMGTISLGQAIHARGIIAEGPRQLVRDLSQWGGVTPFATDAQTRPTKAPRRARRAGGSRSSDGGAASVP